LNSGIDDTIVALATPHGVSALAVIRLSGEKSTEVVSKVFSKPLGDRPSHTIHYGSIRDSDHVIDEVVVSLFRAPKSFTTEDVVEI
jgi:tRNA modification GTPase